ncbi:MAG: amidohydrolase family protein, partial [Pseudobdellovibrionaceae bacterium]
GTLTGKAGVARIHVGPGKRRLQTIREMMERHEVQFDHLYFTHMDRSPELLKEGAAMARLGSVIDLDIHERDLGVWLHRYVAMDGPLDKLSFSTDAGACGPNELWGEIQSCFQKFNFTLEQLIPHVTSIPAQILKLRKKGRLAVDLDADLIVTDKKDLDIRHVMSNGRFFYRDHKFHYEDQLYTARRKADWYGLRK